MDFLLKEIDKNPENELLLKRARITNEIIKNIDKILE